MRWVAFNTLGAMIWLLGVFYVKEPQASLAGILAVGEHQLSVGLAFGTIGLVILLWANLRSTA